MQKKLNNIYPGSKISLVLALMISSLVINQSIFYSIILFLFILIASMYGVVRHYFKTLIKLLFALVFIMFLMIVLTTEGEKLLFGIGIFQVYQEGINIAILMILRIITVCSGILLIYQINTIEDITMVLERIGIPSIGIFIIQSTITMVPQISDKLHVIMAAQSSRGMDFSGNLFTRFKKVVPLLFPLVLSSFYDTEEKALVLISRGIEIPGKKNRLYNKNRKNSDNLLLVFSCLIVLISIYWRCIYA